MGPPGTAPAFLYEVVEPSQVPLEQLGLEGAQYHTRLHLDCTKHPLPSTNASLVASEVSSSQFQLYRVAEAERC